MIQVAWCVAVCEAVYVRSEVFSRGGSFLLNQRTQLYSAVLSCTQGQRQTILLSPKACWAIFSLRVEVASSEGPILAAGEFSPS